QCCWNGCADHVTCLSKDVCNSRECVRWSPDSVGRLCCSPHWAATTKFLSEGAQEVDIFCESHLHLLGTVLAQRPFKGYWLRQSQSSQLRPVEWESHRSFEPQGPYLDGKSLHMPDCSAPDRQALPLGATHGSTDQ